MTILFREIYPYKNTADIFHRTRTNNPKISIVTQKITNSQNNLEKKEQNWWLSCTQIPRFGNIV